MITAKDRVNRAIEIREEYIHIIEKLLEEFKEVHFSPYGFGCYWHDGFYRGSIDIEESTHVGEQWLTKGNNILQLLVSTQLPYRVTVTRCGEELDAATVDFKYRLFINLLNKE